MEYNEAQYFKRQRLRHAFGVRRTWTRFVLHTNRSQHLTAASYWIFTRCLTAATTYDFSRQVQVNGFRS